MAQRSNKALVRERAIRPVQGDDFGMPERADWNGHFLGRRARPGEDAPASVNPRTRPRRGSASAPYGGCSKAERAEEGRERRVTPALHWFAASPHPYGALRAAKDAERLFAIELDMPVPAEIKCSAFFAESLGFETVDHREAVVDLRHVDVRRARSPSAPGSIREAATAVRPVTISPMDDLSLAEARRRGGEKRGSTRAEHGPIVHR